MKLNAFSTNPAITSYKVYELLGIFYIWVWVIHLILELQILDCMLL